VPKVVHIVNSIQHLHPWARSVTNGAVSKIAVLTKIGPIEALVETVQVLKELAVKSHIEPQHLWTVAAPDQGAPATLSSFLTKDFPIPGGAETLVRAGSHVSFCEPFGDLFAQVECAGYVKAQRFMYFQVTCYKVGRRYAIPVTEDEKGLIPSTAYSFIHNHILSPSKVFVPHMLESDTSRSEFRFDRTKESSLVWPGTVIGENQAEVIRGLPQIATKNQPQQGNLVVGGDDYTSVW
jgi:hypothetical protein